MMQKITKEKLLAGKIDPKQVKHSDIAKFCDDYDIAVKPAENDTKVDILNKICDVLEAPAQPEQEKPETNGESNATETASGVSQPVVVTERIDEQESKVPAKPRVIGFKERRKINYEKKRNAPRRAVAGKYVPGMPNGMKLPSHLSPRERKRQGE